ncbi:MarR family winged helix-turn-helix transcriptional regulator [Gryllotalpicola reticulitermitis]|uniref:MarR family winged helix-turn-helix transcriptional regulator n=1 Tax=Gryllotalpicola reticulitermitis TaxID=1184153 RepID=A0ABV8Q2Y2_9MICO
MGEVARYITIDPAAASRVVDRLVGKGLISRGVDPGSRRRVPLRLTPAARALVPELVALADANDAAYFGALTSRQRQELLVLLRSLSAPRSPGPNPDKQHPPRDGEQS